MKIKSLMVAAGIMAATSLTPAYAVYECLNLNNRYTGSGGNDTHITIGTIHNYRFNVEVDDAWSWIGWRTGAYIANVGNAVGSQKIIVRWFVAPFSELKYTLTVFCK